MRRGPVTRALQPRRGANSLEFALLLPVFLLILTATFDYGWYFFQRAAVLEATRQGCRAGSVLEKDNATTPTAQAKSTIDDFLDSYGVSCGDNCEVKAAYTGASPSEQLQCDISIDFDSFTGLVVMPATIDATALALLENQD